ncbi:MAG TPA: hypothetical protein VN873_00910 [Candidatus Angelobacter sp.]|nr:hypothetical protein [Candidatus Angelobacter sp.]
MRSKIVIAAGVVLGIVAVGVGVGLLAGHGPRFTPPAVAQAGTDAGTQVPAGPTPETHPFRPVQPAQAEAPPIVPMEPVVAMQPSNVAPAMTNASNVDTNWEDEIDDIVGSDDPDTNKVQQLYALFPKLPPDGQEEVAQHLSNLVEDEDYAPLAAMAKDDKLSDGVLDELLADALNRPNSLKLPLLLDIASDPNHAKSDEAKDLLELYLGEDYGNDWNAWGQHLTNWLQQNPD